MKDGCCHPAKCLPADRSANTMRKRRKQLNISTRLIHSPTTAAPQEGRSGEALKNGAPASEQCITVNCLKKNHPCAEDKPIKRRTLKERRRKKSLSGREPVNCPRIKKNTASSPLNCKCKSDRRKTHLLHFRCLCELNGETIKISHHQPPFFLCAVREETNPLLSGKNN